MSPSTADELQGASGVTAGTDVVLESGRGGSGKRYLRLPSRRRRCNAKQTDSAAAGGNDHTQPNIWQLLWVPPWTKSRGGDNTTTYTSVVEFTTTRLTKCKGSQQLAESLVVGQMVGLELVHTATVPDTPLPSRPLLTLLLLLLPAWLSVPSVLPSSE